MRMCFGYLFGTTSDWLRLPRTNSNVQRPSTHLTASVVTLACRGCSSMFRSDSDISCDELSSSVADGSSSKDNALLFFLLAGTVSTSGISRSSSLLSFLVRAMLST